MSYDLFDIHQVVGLDGATGRRLWRIRGADPFCNLTARARRDGSSIACVVSGRVTEQQDQDIKRRGLAGQPIGYDPTTGEETWSVELDRRTTEESIIEDLVVRAPEGALVGTDEGRLATEFASGTQTEVADDVVTYCSDGVEMLDSLDRNGGTLLFPCTADGRPTKSAVTEWGVASLPETNGWRLVSVKGKVLGYAA